MRNFRHIAVEGPIGAGKTSLARRLGALAQPDIFGRPTVTDFQAQPATLYERVRRRASEVERGLGEDYLALLAEGYARFFYSYGAAPVLIVNSENLNFVARDADLELLLARMRGMSRRQFFSLG